MSKAQEKLKLSTDKCSTLTVEFEKYRELTDTTSKAQESEIKFLQDKIQTAEKHIQEMTLMYEESDTLRYVFTCIDSYE